jgi:hypothetical protein
MRASAASQQLGDRMVERLLGRLPLIQPDPTRRPFVQQSRLRTPERCASTRDKRNASRPPGRRHTTPRPPHAGGMSRGPGYQPHPSRQAFAPKHCWVVHPPGAPGAGRACCSSGAEQETVSGRAGSPTWRTCRPARAGRTVDTSPVSARNPLDAATARRVRSITRFAPAGAPASARHQGGPEIPT